MTDKSSRMCLPPRAYIPLAVLFVLLQFWVQTNYSLNITDSSVPVGLYRVNGIALNDLREGEVVALRMPIKKIAALPGKHVRFSPEGIYVEEKLLDNTAPEKTLSQVCPYGRYTVPQDMFLGVGTEDPDSWDGRYVCFLPQSLIEGTVSRVW